MPFEMVEKGLEKQEFTCPNCHYTHIVYLHKDGSISKNIFLKEGKTNMFQCQLCYTTLKWTPQKETT